MNIRTQRGAMRRYRAIINQCRRDLSGGLLYGLDMPTLRATFPDRYAELQRLRRMFAMLPAR